MTIFCFFSLSWLLLDQKLILRFKDNNIAVLSEFVNFAAELFGCGCLAWANCSRCLQAMSGREPALHEMMALQ